MVSLFKNITPLSNEKTKGQAAYDQLLLMNNVVVADVFKVCDYKNEAVDLQMQTFFSHGLSCIMFDKKIYNNV